MQIMDINPGTVQSYYEKLDKDAQSGGYHLNPDVEFTKALVEGLMVNENRYGYPSCPCRLSTGVKAEDLDIICPCDYRDPDVVEYNTCFCGLYVSRDAADGKVKIHSIPERRPHDDVRKSRKKEPASSANLSDLPYPVWRCDVCGYLCARDNPPEVCPVCKAKKERFSRFL
jgi:ferredoxin-thioredoxin reductase catalytic chain